jgi:hypothetical protein
MSHLFFLLGLHLGWVVTLDRAELCLIPPCLCVPIMVSCLLAYVLR